MNSNVQNCGSNGVFYLSFKNTDRISEEVNDVEKRTATTEKTGNEIAQSAKENVEAESAQ